VIVHLLTASCTLLNADRKTGHSNLCKTVQNKPRKYTLPFIEKVKNLFWYLAERESSTRFEMVKGIAPPDQLYVKEKLEHCRKFIAQNDTNPTEIPPVLLILWI
jgi:hypothetical protein